LQYSGHGIRCFGGDLERKEAASRNKRGKKSKLDENKCGVWVQPVGNSQSDCPIGLLKKTKMLPNSKKGGKGGGLEKKRKGKRKEQNALLKDSMRSI